jgi:hypothetical protein
VETTRRRKARPSLLDARSKKESANFGRLIVGNRPIEAC